LKRAIYFARFYARIDEAPDIDSVSLLRGMMYDADSRVNTVLGMRERFPMFGGCPCKFPTYKDIPETELHLDGLTRRILARAVWEAGALADHWIDSEHVLLAMMAVGKGVAAQYLKKTGLTVNEARIMVIENKASRPDYGHVSLLWRMWFPFDALVLKLRVWNYRRRKGNR
jgi:hypothetical protein